jgi:hypothetical protein
MLDLKYRPSMRGIRIDFTKIAAVVLAHANLLVPAWIQWPVAGLVPDRKSPNDAGLLFEGCAPNHDTNNIKDNQAAA